MCSWVGEAWGALLEILAFQRQVKSCHATPSILERAFIYISQLQKVVSRKRCRISRVASAGISRGAGQCVAATNLHTRGNGARRYHRQQRRASSLCARRLEKSPRARPDKATTTRMPPWSMCSTNPDVPWLRPASRTCSWRGVGVRE